MDEVELPVVRSDTTITHALEYMQGSKRSGLITELKGRPVVLTAAELVEELQKRKRDVALIEIEPRTPTVDASIDFAVQSFEHPAARRALEAAFASRGAEHAVIAVKGARGRVMTISERVAATLSSSFTVCTCSVDSTHVWFPHQLTDPQKCELDGEKVDCK